MKKLEEKTRADLLERERVLFFDLTIHFHFSHELKITFIFLGT